MISISNCQAGYSNEWKPHNPLFGVNEQKALMSTYNKRCYGKYANICIIPVNTRFEISKNFVCTLLPCSHSIGTGEYILSAKVHWPLRRIDAISTCLCQKQGTKLFVFFHRSPSYCTWRNISQVFLKVFPHWGGFIFNNVTYVHFESVLNNWNFSGFYSS